MSEKYLSELHKEYVKWGKDIEFYRDELTTFKHRLEEIITQNTKTEVTSMVEHFQNQFIRQEEVMDELRHDINAAEHALAENAKANNVATDHRKAEEDAGLVDRMNMFVKIYDELKDEFTRFAADVM